MWLQGWKLKAHLPCLPLSQRQGGWIKHQWSVIESTIYIQGVQFSSVAQSCLTLCNPMDCSMPRPLCPHQLPEFTQTPVHWVGDAIQPSHLRSSPSPPTFNLSQHQSLFKWVIYKEASIKKKNDGGWESSRLVSMWRCWEGCSLWRTRKVHATSHTPCPCVSFIWLFQSSFLLRSTSDLVSKLFSWVLRAALANYWTEERVMGMYRMTWTCYWCLKWEGRTVLRDRALNLWDLMLLPGGCCQNWIKLGFLGGSDSKESAGNAGDPGSIPGSGRSPGEGNGNPVFLLGEFHGQKSLVGYRLRGHKETDMTEWLTLL